MKDTAGAGAAITSEIHATAMTLGHRRAAQVVPPGRGIMPIDAAHWNRRAEEARRMARLCDDPALVELLEEVARGYDDLAASRRRPNKRCADLAAAGHSAGRGAAYVR
jgi:hypothetical protein